MMRGMDEPANPVQDAWRALKANAGALPSFWTSVYRDGLQAAFRNGDPGAGAGLAIFAAVSLEAQGNLTSSLIHLNDALAIFSSDRPSRARLLARKATFEAIGGIPTATETIASARRGIRVLDAEVVFELDIFTAVVGAISLRPDTR